MIDLAIKRYVNRRIREFEKLGENGYVVFDFRPFLDMSIHSNILTELAFCISVTNDKAINGLKFQNDLNENSLNNIDKIKIKLKNSGIRYYETKSRYIYEAIRKFNDLKYLLKIGDEKTIRKYMIKNFKGIGLKVASHFLRNIGFKDIAIIDRHVLRFLYENGFIKNIPKNINYDLYIKMENILRGISKEYSITLAELDLYIWYSKTGMVLK